MRPDGNAQNILSTTRATAKMHEFRVASEDFIALPRDPAMLFVLAVGILGDVAATIAGEKQDGVDLGAIASIPCPAVGASAIQRRSTGCASLRSSSTPS
jgi:helicase